MLLRYFYDKALAQASYMIGCVATGEALVIDPSRDIQPYLDMARSEGVRITHVTETHIHADYVSGSRELGSITGAQVYLSDEGDADWKYQYLSDGNITLIRDGDVFMVGNIKVEVFHTPGHTPEHIVFVITDTAGADKPMGIFTGDFIFAGDVGRPDLLEEAAGIADTKEPGARDMFRSLKRFKDMPDYLQIWPGHGAGSACGKALGAVPSTTLGYEKLFNPALQITDEDAFVEWLLEGQPEAPFYFAQMKKVNKEGPVLLNDLSWAQSISRQELDEALKAGNLALDLRAQADFGLGHAHGSINIPMTNRGYVNYVGWFVDYSKPTYLIVPDDANIQAILTTLQTIGVDDVAGYVTESELLTGEMAQLPTISASELAQRLPDDKLLVIDVRGKGEYGTTHIEGALNIPVGHLRRMANEHLPKDYTLVTSCASGYRSAIAASVLRSMGYQNVLNMPESASVWSQILPTV
jgi:hydroxyacylglutathione hydrolase